MKTLLLLGLMAFLIPQLSFSKSRREIYQKITKEDIVRASLENEFEFIHRPGDRDPLILYANNFQG